MDGAFARGYGSTKRAHDILLDCLFQAMAAAAQNPDAYVFIPRDREPYGLSKWAAIEYIYLRQNFNVKRIWRVDPRPDAQCGQQAKVLLWDRDRGDPVRLPTDPMWPFLCPNY
jgi:hypothetical protein